jgi:hypothetical protein
MPSSSCLRRLPCLFITHILPYIFPSVTCFRRQSLRKMWLISLTFLLFIICTIFLFSILLQHHISKFSTRLRWLSEMSRFQHLIMLRSKCSTSLVCSFNLLVKRIFLLNAASAMAILSFVSRVRLISFMLCAVYRTKKTWIWRLVQNSYSICTCCSSVVWHIFNRQYFSGYMWL